ncbi:MAG: hypothetical protein D3926_20490 [Desulfobacteraceae bacterium]|mgnify:CR=1 FL=1|nr:MAG: hypothetical protein D3926_20490 [Desulfobacteraceae bacterium]
MTVHLSNIGFHRLRVCSMGRGPATRPPGTLEGGMMADFDLSINIEFLFPFINAVARNAQLFDNPPHIRFSFEHTLCVLYPDRGLASPFDDKEDAGAFMVRFIAYLNDIYHRQESIEPRHKCFSHTATTQILKLLPQTNCNECGFNTCMAFAAMLGRQQTIPGRCPHISRPLQEKAVFPVHDDNGKLLSTISLDIDNTENMDALESARNYIRNLEKKIEALSLVKSELQQEANQELPSPLSRREVQVLQMLALGSTNMEIAHALHISPHTVKSHINNIFNKLAVNSRTQASVWATQNHFI